MASKSLPSFLFSKTVFFMYIIMKNKRGMELATSSFPGYEIYSKVFCVDDPSPGQC